MICGGTWWVSPLFCSCALFSQYFHSIPVGFTNVGAARVRAQPDRVGQEEQGDVGGGPGGGRQDRGGLAVSVCRAGRRGLRRWAGGLELGGVRSRAYVVMFIRKQSKSLLLEWGESGFLCLGCYASGD